MLIRMANTMKGVYFVCLLIGAISVLSGGAENSDSSVSVLVPKAAFLNGRSIILANVNDAKAHNITVLLTKPSENDSTEIIICRTNETNVTAGVTVMYLDIPRVELQVYNVEVHVDCNINGTDCLIHQSSLMKIIAVLQDVIIRPNSYYYKPGEKIEFGVVAIHPDLLLPSQAFGRVSLINPQGQEAAAWSEVTFGSGSKEFEVLLSERAPVGKWLIKVETLGMFYTCALNISSSRGSYESPKREQVVAEKHFVELRFSTEMHRKYKPGLPLIGKVEAMSSEKEVRVRVKVIDEQSTILYSQDIDLEGKDGTFIVPAVITNTSKIELLAELISVGGKDVNNQYVLARETFHKWQSKSDCYLLIKNVQFDMKSGSNVSNVTVLSSCPQFTEMYYVVTNEGIPVAWAVDPIIISKNNMIYDYIMQGVVISEFNLSIPLNSRMCPVSQLLVYYVTKEGEVIGDSMKISVPLADTFPGNIISVDTSKVWNLGQDISVNVTYDWYSVLCILGGRTFPNRTWRNDEMLPTHTAEAGVSVFSIPAVQSPLTTNANLPIHYSFLPSDLVDQTWIWKCYGKNAKKNLSSRKKEDSEILLPSPPTVGEWKLWTISMTPNTGELRIPEKPFIINVFSPITAKYELPHVVRVWEIVHVEVNIMSNVDTCVDLYAVIALSDGLRYPGMVGSVVSEKLRLGAHGATSVVVRVQANSPGIKSMNVSISSYVREKCDDSGHTTTYPDNEDAPENVLVNVQKFEVIPEGIEKSQTDGSYSCANELILDIPADDLRYNFISAPKKANAIIFQVKARENVHIALAESKLTSSNMYHIALGDYNNVVSWIGRGKGKHEVHLATVQTKYLLSDMERRTFWISWDENSIYVGSGKEVGEKTFMKYTTMMGAFIDRIVNYVGFATGWGVPAEFRVWEYKDDAGFSQVLHLDLPEFIVPGSEKGYLLINGGFNIPIAYFQNVNPWSNVHPFSSFSAAIASPSYSLLREFFKDDEYIQFPAEILDYLDRQEFNLSRTYIGPARQVIYSYFNKDNSFSDHPKKKSLSDSMKAMDILWAMDYFMDVDKTILENVKKYILQNQKNSGCFQEEGVDNIEDDVISTATAVLLLYESSLEEDRKYIQKAQGCLEEMLDHIDTPYALVITTYTLYMMGSYEFDEALQRLNRTISDKDGELRWISSSYSSESSFDWLYEDGIHKSEERKRDTELVNEYKASLYLLMLYSRLSDTKRAQSVLDYIYYHSRLLDQHPELTLLMEKAMKLFVSYVGKKVPPLLTVSLATSGMELTDTIQVDGNHIPKVIDLPSLPTKVFIYATGRGCATIQVYVQGKVTYSTYKTAKDHTNFELWSEIVEEVPARYNLVADPEGTFPQLHLKTCFKTLQKVHGAVRLEVDMFSGYTLISASSNIPDMQFGSQGHRFWFSFYDVPAMCVVCVRYSAESLYMITSLRPIFVRLYDVKYPQFPHEMFFHTSRKTSVLLNGLTDNDFESWLGHPIGTKMEMPDDQCQCNNPCKINEILNTTVMSYSIDGGNNITHYPLPKSTINPEMVKEEETEEKYVVVSKSRPGLVTSIYANSKVMTEQNSSVIFSTRTKYKLNGILPNGTDFDISSIKSGVRSRVGTIKLKDLSSYHNMSASTTKKSKSLIGLTKSADKNNSESASTTTSSPVPTTTGRIGHSSTVTSSTALDGKSSSTMNPLHNDTNGIETIISSEDEFISPTADGNIEVGNATMETATPENTEIVTAHNTSEPTIHGTEEHDNITLQPDKDASSLDLEESTMNSLQNTESPYKSVSGLVTEFIVSGDVKQVEDDEISQNTTDSMKNGEDVVNTDKCLNKPNCNVTTSLESFEIPKINETTTDYTIAENEIDDEYLLKSAKSSDPNENYSKSIQKLVIFNKQNETTGNSNVTLFNIDAIRTSSIKKDGGYKRKLDGVLRNYELSTTNVNTTFHKVTPKKISRSKRVVVVGQNELVLDSEADDEIKKAGMMKKSNNESTTTSSTLWSMLKEVAYDPTEK